MRLPDPGGACTVSMSQDGFADQMLGGGFLIGVIDLRLPQPSLTPSMGEANEVVRERALK
jgi:hypothetical protein